MLSDGMNVDPQYQVQVLSNKVAQAAVREAHLESAVQQLLAEVAAMSQKIATLEEELGPKERSDAPAPAYAD
jgi:histidinol-phosphate/aromatic aminotransferase/cobyric acid decarboxylase-like protein